MCRVAAISLVAILFLVGSIVDAGEPRLNEQIDRILDRALAEQGISPAPPASDATFLRRAMLDLAGRIPTSREAQEFAKDTSSDKRERLVTELLRGPESARRLRNHFDAMLMPGTRDAAWREYLLGAFAENRPWDAIFREVLLAEGGENGDGAAAFLKRRVRELDDLTRDVSSMFFGVDISCAKCHDHPLVDDWKQDHFYGLSTFFARLHLNKEKRLAERGDGIVKFQTTDGEEKTAKVMFLTGFVVPQGDNESDNNASDGEASDRASASLRRRSLVDVALSDDARHFFARSIVNRVWAMYFGLGFVSPIDQMHAANDPSHPELLELLAADLVDHGYDLRRLIGAIVRSQAYARTSVWAEESRPYEDTFAVFEPRPLSPSQFALSLSIAGRAPESLPGFDKSDDWAQRRDKMEQDSWSLGRHFEMPRQGFQVGVAEALLLTNGEQIERRLLDDGDGSLVNAMLGADDVSAAIDAAYWSVLSRRPEDQERSLVEEYMEGRGSDPAAAYKQIVWSLATSAEFRFNH